MENSQIVKALKNRPFFLDFLVSRFVNVRFVLQWKRTETNIYSDKSQSVEPSSLIGHFRVPPGLCFKTSLGVQPLIWKSFFILMQIKLIFTRKVVHLASFWKWGSLELGSGLEPWKGLYLFVYLYQQMKTTLKSTGHEIYISVKKSFTIFSCISMHLAILQRQLGVSLNNLFFFLILWLENVISYSNSFEKSQTRCVSKRSIHNVRGRQGLRYFSFFRMGGRRSKETEELKSLRQWEGGAKTKSC